MCVTRYTDESGNQLPADKQKVLWIDGLSIVPNQISAKIEPIGICLHVDGNKAMVKYKTDDSSNNRVFSTTNSVSFDVGDIEPNCYLNNGFYNNQQKPTRHAGCCKARFYQKAQETVQITQNMVNIFEVPGKPYMPVSLNDFNGNDYCSILKSNFNSYDEYLESMMIKNPCAKAIVGKFPSGKYITYKLAKSSDTFKLLDWAAKTNVNAPKLGKGNWWLPSVAEMVQMMYDVTYGTSFWETKPDIVNRVIDKFNSSGRETWDMLSPLTHMWTSSKYSSNNAYFYYTGDGNVGCIQMNIHENLIHSIPITIYEF